MKGILEKIKITRVSNSGVVWLLVWFFLAWLIFVCTVNWFMRDDLMERLNLILVARTLLVFFLIILTGYLFTRYVVKNSGINVIAGNVSLVLVSVFTVFLLLESAFCHISKSHSFFMPYASRVWLHRYNHPINDLGFRDREIELDSNRELVVFIGDSFTAGNGLEDIRERYSDRIRERFRDYNVINCGISGANTRGELNILKNLPVKPDIVVWQYFFNDFEGIRPDHHYEGKLTPYSDLGWMSRWFVKHSFVFNYVYWSSEHDYLAEFVRQLEADVRDQAIIEPHLKDLDSLVAYCSNSNIQLMVVAFPLFIFPETHPFNRHVNRVVEFFRVRQVPVVDVQHLTKAIPVRDKIVNESDPHSSVLVNKIVADSLAQLLKGLSGTGKQLSGQRSL